MTIENPPAAFYTSTMKILRLFLLGFFVAFAAPAFGQSLLDKVKEGANKAVDATKNAVRTAADKVGTAAETAGDKVKEALNKDESEKPKTVTETTVVTQTAAPAPLVGIADPNAILAKVEKELGRPLTQEERDRYALALENAKARARAAENDFAVQITEITGLDPVKSGQIVRSNGL